MSSESSSPGNGVGTHLHYSSNNSLINVTSARNYWGIYLYSSHNNTIENATLYSDHRGMNFDLSNDNNVSNSSFQNHSDGFVLTNSPRGYITNITTNDTSGYGIYCDSDNTTLTNFTSNYDDTSLYIVNADNNIFTNVTIKYARYGVIFETSGDNNNLTDSWIENCTTAGLYFDDAGSIPNLLYNNMFNTTGTHGNVRWGSTIHSNNWNTTNQTGTRIHLNGTQIGGNYWTNSTGNGYSDTCTDSDKDGFCDDSYAIDPDATGNNTDYFPLSDNYGVSSCIYDSGNWVVDCSENCDIEINTDIGVNDIHFTGTGTIYLNANIIVRYKYWETGCELVYASGKEIVVTG